MKYIIVFALCALATLKVTVQGGFVKSSVKNTSDTMLFNAMFFAFTSLLYLPEILTCSHNVWVYAFFAAIFSVIFQFAYATALSAGNVSLTVLIVNFSMVIVVLFSYFVYREPISPLRLIGIIVTLAAFFLCTDFRNTQRMNRKWLLFSLLAWLSTSSATIVQKMFAETEFNNENRAFISCIYIIAASVAFLVYLVLNKSGHKKTFKVDRRAVLYAAMVGLSLSVYQLLNTYAISVIDGTFLFPACSGGTIIFSALSGIVIFKDKLTKRQYLSLLAGVVAIILMNF